ncbi:folylpolyglutamate synthase isoform X2 [Nymphaea colorata]|uniref:folylpolyglutamate synthase isoform X2 n=1 Tax=Nymphaea colorata TaxID=210225 RepID=UPI00129D3F86|nr:folylpolyglutamate synthase isoform X2 [Nymphaea colorata]
MGSNRVEQAEVCDSPPLPSYETAMEALSSLISRRRRGSGSKLGNGSPQAGPVNSKLQLMEKYLKILELEDSIDGLNIIHVAGTKGKGSTCTFSEAILRACGLRTGLFTSPHLIDVRERYRINGLDISEDKFLQYFWDCWNKLKENLTDDIPMPPLFQFLTLLAFQIFTFEKVDVAIVEVGLGGRLDSTNVIKKPIVCGVTSLGMDHMEILGDTLGKIASEKAGIFKAGVPAFTTPQPVDAMVALQRRASELMIPLQVAMPLDPNRFADLKLGLAGDHQYTNAGLAISLCQCWIQRTGHSKGLDLTIQKGELPTEFFKGLSVANLNGRAQIVYDTSANESSERKERNSGDLIFFLDGAHSPESMEVCARWFSHVAKDERKFGADGMKEQVGKSNGPNKNLKNVLLFNCMEVRDPQVLLPRLVNTCASNGVHFSKAFFVPSLSLYNKVGSSMSPVSSSMPTDLSWQFNLQRIWEKLIHGRERSPSYDVLFGDPPQKCDSDSKATASAVIPTLPLTIRWLRECIKQNPSLRIQVLVTGSLHLVGDVLKLLRR